MRPRAIAAGVFTSATVLVVGWQIGANQVAATTSLPASTSSSESIAPTTSTSSKAPTKATQSGVSTPSASTSPTTAATASGTTTKSGTFTGTTIETRYGPMQVQIVVAAGKITNIKALQLTDQGGRSVEISNQAAPVLRTEALSAQSANIQSVTGATYTSDGYKQSLQSALDKAGL